MTLRSLVRRLIGPVVRWAAVGGTFSSCIYRSKTGLWIVFEGVYDDEYSRSFTPDEARDFARDLMRFARDVQEGAPVRPPEGVQDEP